jgi:hypothetical protein
MDKLLLSMPVDIMRQIPFHLEINGLIKYLMINKHHFNFTQIKEIISDYLDFYFCKKADDIIFQTITQIDNDESNKNYDKLKYLKCIKCVPYDVTCIQYVHGACNLDNNDEFYIDIYERNNNNKFIDLYYKQNIKNTEIFETYGTNNSDEYNNLFYYHSDITSKIIKTSSFIGILATYPILKSEIKLIISNLHKMYSYMYIYIFKLRSEQLRCYFLQIIDFDLEINDIEWNQEYNERIMNMLTKLGLIRKIKIIILILHKHNIIYPKMDKLAFLITQCGRSKRLVTYQSSNCRCMYAGDLKGTCMILRDVTWGRRTKNVTSYEIDIIYIAYLFNLHHSRMFDIRTLYGFFYSLDTYIILSGVKYFDKNNFHNDIDNVLISNYNPIAIREYIREHNEMIVCKLIIKIEIL